MDEASGYVWGPVNAEDLGTVPESNWLMSSGMRGVGAPLGRLYAVDVTDYSCNEIFPYLASFALDEARFGSQQSLDVTHFEPHGIDIARREDGVMELYVVNHGWRESVEVFEIDLSAARPTLRWIGCAELPARAVGNDVAVVAGGGFVVSTNLANDASGPRFVPDSGRVLEWSPSVGWSSIPGTEINSANGVAVSSDGQWVYVAGWRSRCIKRAHRFGHGVDTCTVDTGILTDNLTWTADGQLLAAGVYDTTIEEFLAGHNGPDPRLFAPSRVLRVDPEHLTFDVVVEYGRGTFSAATTGLQVGSEIWVGSAHGHGLARFTSAQLASRS